MIRVTFNPGRGEHATCQLTTHNPPHHADFTDVTAAWLGRAKKR